jgi:type I restriction enzyme R subunit
MVSRSKRKFADYVQYYKPNIPITIIEAKDNNHSVGDGMQQALEYAATNGDGFAFMTKPE